MLALAIAIVLCATSACSEPLPPPCDSDIYCHGELLHTVQMARIYEDSKTFVDKKLLHSPEETWTNFRTLMNATNNQPSKVEIAKFVDDNFADGNELDKWTPTDHVENPAFLMRIRNVTVREFAKNLTSRWPLLAVKIKEEVSANLDRYSLIPVPNGFVIPGGRFREFYYWDSYWILEGLLISEMFDTARGMIENFIFIVEKYGFMPNGGRIYYLNRSQPPLLTAMAHRYFTATSNTTWVRKHIHNIAKELRFWLDKRTVPVNVGGCNLTLARYSVPASGPRPESYREDYATAKGVEQVYVDLKSGAESGWDFSSRWFFDEDGGNNANLSSIMTSRAIPVDLNAYLCGAFRDIAQMYLAIGDMDNSAFWKAKYTEWRRAVHVAFWNRYDGTWYDLDSQSLKQRRYFYGSNLAPLWSRCYESKRAPQLANATVSYLEREGILGYLGGVPTSVLNSGEQWDLPNAWPPLQDIAINGLRSTGDVRARSLANQLAHRWVDANILGFTTAGDMFEKYDAAVPGQYGGGGEYSVQTGFGWTNGVALKFIKQFYT
ncbi:hypothetical protein PPYR_03563 [Photinus pyralis]|uniref:Trehalase n=1 Tax=Photinus pyralis TaxID=7054 RepID=A0A1Y1LGB5_PHOPY|nr:trehalase-like [Photinus pyralis]KAB0791763.1 hypothetical protein PPYR_03563 [Photinus pyralis]